MKLSITIPVYNVEKYFPATMESLLNQSYFKNHNDFEIILIDDGSKDLSGKMCDEYAERYSFIRVIHQENAGLSHGRNVSIKEAKGKYLSMIDGDDILHPDYYTRMVSVLDETGLPVVKCNRYYLDKGAEPNFENIKKDYKIYSCEKALINDLVELRRPLLVEGMCTKLYRKEILEGLEFDENLRNEEDFLFVSELLFKKFNFAKIEDILYFVVFNENSNTNNPDYLIRNINSIVNSKIALINKLKELKFDKINRIVNNSFFQICDEYAYWLNKKNNIMPDEVTEKIINEFVSYESVFCNIYIRLLFYALKNRKYNFMKFLQRKIFKSLYKRTGR